MSRINPDVFTFYRELKENNTREWFEPQKSRFKALETEIKQYTEEIKMNLNKLMKLNVPRFLEFTVTYVFLKIKLLLKPILVFLFIEKNQNSEVAITYI